MIAHSHGGNVAARAIALLDPGSRPVGVATLATPFLHIRERALNKVDHMYMVLAAVACRSGRSTLLLRVRIAGLPIWTSYIDISQPRRVDPSAIAYGFGLCLDGRIIVWHLSYGPAGATRPGGGRARTYQTTSTCSSCERPATRRRSPSPLPGSSHWSTSSSGPSWPSPYGLWSWSVIPSPPRCELGQITKYAYSFSFRSFACCSYWHC